MKKKSKANILLVEDDKNLAFVLTDYLSMSGYGVNVSELIKTCGWKSNIKTKEPGDDPMSWVAGIVLLG
jgi:hypothetical protein